MNTILIDTNVFNKIFNTDNSEHKSYSLVYKAVFERKLKFIIGGTKYKKELSGITEEPFDFQKIERKLMKTLLQYKTARYIEEFDDAKVDKEQIQIINLLCELFINQKFDDSLNIPEIEVLRNRKLINEIQNNHYTDEEIKTCLINDLEIRPDFDDPHIVALLNISNCKNICTDDYRAIPFFKEKSFYSNSVIPKIHTKQSLENAGLEIKE